METHSCEVRYWEAGEYDTSNKSMSPQQAADWRDRTAALKKLKQMPKIKGESCAERNWRMTFRLLFPETEIPSHRKLTLPPRIRILANRLPN